MLYKLDVDVDIERLAQALDKVIEAHPYVKSRLVTDENGEVVFEDHSEDEFHTSVFEIADIEDVRAHLGEDYDLMHDRLFRLEIYKTQNGNYLYVDFHHIVFDGMSFAVCRADVAKAYAGEPLEGEPMNGFQIAEAEVAVRNSDVYQEAKEWYEKEFGGATEVESMPLADVYDVADEHFITVWNQLSIDKPALDALCEKAGVKESMVFTAGFGYTLSKFTGDDEALYTSVFHGRSDKATRRAFCMMVKTLPLYHNFKDTPNVVELLQQTSAQTSGTRKRTCYSFSELHADLGIQSEICFVYQGNLTTLSLFLDGKEQQGEDLRKHRAGIKLNVQIITKDGGYFVKVEYPSNKFTPEFIDSFCKTYDKILREMLIKDTLAEIEPCDEEQIAKLDSFNEHDTLRYDDDDDNNETVLSLFQKAAKQYPDNVAAVFKEKKYTYRELDELTDKIGALIYNKVKDCEKEEPVVSILVHRNEYIFILPLAVMKAGCAYQPLDPSYPQERLNFMVKDADAALLIADEDLRPIINEYEGEVLLTSELTDGSLKTLTLSRPDTLTPQSLFILLYTSGSTGVPKGVMLEHGNLVSFIKWYGRYYDLKPEHNVAAYASFGFDANMMDMYPALTTGATVHVIPEELRLDLMALNEYFEQNQITHSFITTQVGVQFLQNTDNHSLKHLSVGGEKLVSVDPAENYTFHNGYGPTECTIFSTTLPVLKKEPNIPIGKPTDELECYVMDKQLHRLPVGAAGELVIVGKQVGRGYLNRPDKTAEAFFTYNGERAYHSGDIVRYREDGNIEFVGRKDGQVKIRGFRIELKEVEAVIRDFPGISDVTVQAFDDPNGGKFIAAYIVSDNEVDIEALNNFILDQKPPYMVPAVTMQIPEIPLNVNQKVDKKALPKPEKQLSSPSSSSSCNTPLNALETELKTIIASVVGTEEFGVTDMLGYVGLTSISGIKLASLLYKRFGVKIPTKNISRSNVFEIENILLQYFMQGGTSQEAKAEAPVENITEVPLTFSQQGVYMDCQMNPDTTMYNIPMMLTFPASVEAETLRDAVVNVAQMHPALFCNFFQTGQGVVMRKPAELSLDVTVKTLSNEGFEAEKATFVHPFDLEHDCLIRAEIVTTPGDSKVLLLDMHHLVSDGGSYDIFVNQLVAVLNGKDVVPESYDYLRFATEQNEKAEKGGLEEDKVFYDEMFAQYEAAANVPANKTSTEEGIPRHTSTPIPAEVMNAQLPMGVSKAHFWFAAFNYALSRFANTKDIYTAFISNGRQNLDIVDTVGMFVNTLPCAVHVKEQTVEEFIKEVSKTFTDVISHENYPFARIAADYDFKGSASFAYQLGIKSDYVVNGSVVTESVLSLNKAKIALSIYIQYVDGVPSVMAEYDDSQYTNDLILRFTESIVAVAEHFMADLTAKVKNVSIMSERQRLEVEAMHSVNEDMTFPIRTFHEGIEQWAVKTPDALALMACDRDMTYREYNAEANQMARALMARGMKYGDRVVLLLPRRSYYLTALFAVMKCGGAFIPMDPEYPADRIAYILDDSEGRFVITTPEKVADYPDRAIDIFQLLEEAKAQPTENLDVKVDPHDLAYLIYTSGSTGRPKGVMIEHLGAASFLTFYKSDTNFGVDAGANRVGLCQSTVSFDLSVGEIGVQVFNGDTVAFANEDEMMSPVEMIKLCRRTGAQTISGTPSRLAVNLELGEYYDLIKDQMKCVVTGGEKLPGALLDELEKMDVYIINTYGPTETTMGSSAGVLNGTREVHVGKPFTNYTYQVLDSDRNELPVGVMGELCIGGIGLARGYNNMPERTAETFIQWQGKRIYRTGDYAMWTKDGNIIIMGRTDNQVKLNGLRIELGEIETVMSQQPGMRQCVAIIKKLGNIDKLIGYYTVDETVANIPVADYEEQVRADMAVKLTPYMVPGIFVRLDEMPLTPVGKTDVKRLPMPDLQTGEYVAPKNDVEKTFCEIFAKILNLKRISATDNFFELAGTSLVAMQLIGEASNAGYNIVPKSIFDNATPHLLARMLKPELYQGEDTKKKLPMADEIEAYDYAQLDDILAANTIDNFRANKCYDQMGNVLLAGATGFLGIHVLHNLIERNDVPYIYCLVRSNKVLSAKSRLRTQLFYYFDNAYNELFENGRITVIEGDVTNAEVFEQFNQPLDVVINCAANVKHFSAGTDIEDINIKGCQNCIDLCLRTGARFIQTSTGSIAGNSVGDTAASPIIFTERDLYHNQELTTKYAASKFLAERNVLDAVKNHGLKGKIMRLGNLSARSTDGEFQINFRSNNAMATLKAFQVLGCIPYEREFGYSEFSPINEVADAIVRLSMTPDCCTIFQPGNVHWPPYGDIIECMNRIGIHIERVEQDEFQKRLAEAMNDAEKSDLVQSLVAYREASDGRVHVMNGWDTKAYTGQILLRLGFRWSFTTWDYVERYLQCLQGLGVFDSDFKR